MIIILEIFLLLIAPILAIQFKIVPYKFRPYVFAPVFLIIILLTYLEGNNPYELGIRTDNISRSFIPYSLFTLIGAFLIYIVAKKTNKKKVINWWRYPHFQYGFVVLSILQEFAYRSFLIPKLQILTQSVLLIIIFNSLIFAYIHIIYPNKKTNLTLSFLGGIGFSGMYLYFPNLLLISFSHSVLNFVSLLYGLIGPDDFNNKKS